MLASATKKMLSPVIGLGAAPAARATNTGSAIIATKIVGGITYAVVKICEADNHPANFCAKPASAAASEFLTLCTLNANGTMTVCSDTLTSIKQSFYPINGTFPSGECLQELAQTILSDVGSLFQNETSVQTNYDWGILRSQIVNGGENTLKFVGQNLFMCLEPTTPATTQAPATTIIPTTTPNPATTLALINTTVVDATTIPPAETTTPSFTTQIVSTLTQWTEALVTTAPPSANENSGFLGVSKYDWQFYGTRVAVFVAIGIFIILAVFIVKRVVGTRRQPGPTFNRLENDAMQDAGWLSAHTQLLRNKSSSGWCCGLGRSTASQHNIDPDWQNYGTL